MHTTSNNRTFFFFVATIIPWFRQIARSAHIQS